MDPRGEGCPEKLRVREKRTPVAMRALKRMASLEEKLGFSGSTSMEVLKWTEPSATKLVVP